MAKSVNGEIAEGEGANDGTTPICRCRVLYLGSAVPHITKDGLQGIQEPLRDLYPEQGVFWNSDREQSATGIDSWLSVWSNGILVENVDDKGNTERRFHPIESLHYCAAIRYVSVPANPNDPHKGPDGKIAKFLPLDSPFSKNGLIDIAMSGHPPLFACILRRTTGIKVLECHAFICKKEPAANALVRCCFHAYADTMHARQIEVESPYEQLDKRRSRSIGSALDSASLIDEKINNWQKNSTGGSSSGTPEETNGYADARLIARHKARTPSMVSLVSHTMPDGAGHHHVEPIYYNGNANGTLRSVRSFISLATLKGQKKYRSRQVPMPMSPQPPQMPVMFATLSKKELKKALKKESTLKRKHKYKDFPGPFLAPNGIPMIYGPPPMGPHGAMLGPPMLQNGMHPIYAPLPPPHGPFYTLNNRKGRMHMLPPSGPHGQPMMPPPGHMMSDNGFPSQMIEREPIYMPAHAVMPSPNGTLRRPITPHGEPIYIDNRTLQGPPPPMGPMGPQPIFVPHPQTGIPMPMMPTTLSRKELKEMEKQKQLMKKAEKQMLKKEKKNSKKNGGKIPNGQMDISEPLDLYQPKPFELQQHEEEMMLAEMQHHAAMANGGYVIANGNGGTASSGIYKKKGHMNERAFSYSIRQEHRSRSNSLSNLTFENGGTPIQVHGAARNGEEPTGSNGHNSYANLKAQQQQEQHHHQQQQQQQHHRQQQHQHQQPYQQHSNSVPNFQQSQPYMNGNVRMAESNGALHHLADGVDPNLLAHRISGIKLNGAAAPPPPPLPNGHHAHYQKTATIKRL